MQNPNNSPQPLALATILNALPDDVVVPVGWVREKLQEVRSDNDDGFLSAAEFARQRNPRRSVEWVREMCRKGTFHGAYKDGKEWMIPAKALNAPLSIARSPSTNTYTRRKFDAA